MEKTADNEKHAKLPSMQRVKFVRHAAHRSLSSFWQSIYGPQHEKTCLWRGGGGREGTSQGHLRSLISAFFTYVLEGNISKLATSEISIFYLVSVAEQAGLNLTLSVNRKTGFVATRPI